ncbi:unnamed protein product [Phytophthora fragariaefolia]|uniref:Unnamed protein product n=1 Tax=Phytophthora fragariaefolia TaxID=1490495 RepID=A0A9W6TW90_9STRA|nr:unnamed protein product [Phytophthora fragariaefolia]
MDKAENDVNARLIKYFKSFNSIVEENSLTECCAGTNGSREKCKRQVSNEEFWTNMKKARRKKVRLKRLGELLSSEERMVALNGKFELPHCPNSGSDYTSIWQSHWRQLKALGPSVIAIELGNPSTSKVYGSATVVAK